MSRGLWWNGYKGGMKEFSRYHTGASTDQWQPGSNQKVLRNLKGITNPDDIDQLEYQLLIQVKEKYLSLIQLDTRFTSKLIKAMHRDWLRDLYEWAGDYRTVEMAKGDFMWPPANRVAPNMARFARSELRKHTPCLPNADNKEKVAHSLAVVHGSLLLIHPFREGNGRLARWLADMMAMQAGYNPLDYQLSNDSQGPDLYLDGVKRSYLNDYDLLESFFAASLRRSSSSSF